MWFTKVWLTATPLRLYGVFIEYPPKFAKGELQSVDGYMNIALEKTEEFVNGQLRKVYGDAFVRGNNGVHDKSINHLDVYADHIVVMYISSDS